MVISDPVTVVVRRKVKPGCEAAYEAWLARLTESVAASLPGYLGAEFHRPGADGAYRSVFRFDGIDNLERFERSELRARMLDEAAPLFASEAAWERMTGLEFWFDPPPGTKVPQPDPHRMAVVLVVVVFVLVLAINLTLGPLLAGLPLPLRLLIGVVLQVAAMTYAIMPWLTPRIAVFVYPRTTTV